MAGWRATLLMAARQAWRAKGRSLLVVILVSLPVAVVTFVAIGYTTQDIRGGEALERRLGAAQALVFREAGVETVMQAADPFAGGFAYAYDESESPGPDVELGEVLGGARLVPMDTLGWSQVRVGERKVSVEAFETDLDDPLTRGLFDLTDGRLPAEAGEVVVNDELLARGLALGDTLGEGGPVIVGSGRDARTRTGQTAYGLPGSFETLAFMSPPVTGHLVDGDPVTWEQVLQLNGSGWVVGSRSVIENPPASTEMDLMDGQGHVADGVEVGGLIALLVLIEVVLLAGPAFAVGARQHSRTIALVALNGGTPAQARRVVMASAVVLGGVAAVVGTVVGIGAAAAGMPVLQQFSTEWFGPFDVPWLWLLGIAAFGLVSALLAAAVPAWLAAREDVVRVLAGRRGDASPDPKLPVLGIALLVVGVGGASMGAVDSQDGGGTGVLAASILIGVLGMVLVVPMVVSLLARVGGGLPLSVRYATRDAARHRSRSVPAVAAVAATVAGVIALGIGTASDATEARETYMPGLPDSMAAVSWWDQRLPGDEVADPEQTFDELTDIVGRTAPDLTVARVQGVRPTDAAGNDVFLSIAGPDDTRLPLLTSYGSALGSSVLLPSASGLLGLDADTRARVDAALAAGKVVAFANHDIDVDEVTVSVERWSQTSPESDEPPTTTSLTVPAEAVRVEHAFVLAIVPQAVADELEVPTGTVGLALEGPLDRPLEKQLAESIAGFSDDAGLFVERGYTPGDDLLIVAIVLWSGGLLLMLAGTLTATFLAIGDARSDLATLQAVGAEPRTRRRVAASYALLVSGVGAVLGVVVGFVPGIATARALTYADYWGGGVTTGPYVTIPWLLIAAVVVGLPLLASAVVGLTARSKLPMVARID